MQPVNASQVDNLTYGGFKDVGITLEANYFNYNNQVWEPILENFTLVLNSYNEYPDKNKPGALPVGRTSVTFGDRNPNINLSTELQMLLTSVTGKLGKPLEPRTSKQLLVRSITSLVKNTVGGNTLPPLSEYDELAVLDKQKIFNFINNVAEKNRVMESRNLNWSTDHTVIYGYDEPVKPGHHTSMLGQPLLTQENFADKASLRHKNPLNFRFNDEAALGNGMASSIAISRQSIVGGGKVKRPNKNPLHSVYNVPKIEYLDPRDVELLRTQNEQSKQIIEDNYFREIPFRVENMTGKDVVFAISFYNIPKASYVKNLESRDIEYPYTLENTLLHSGFIDAKSKHVTYKVYIVDENTNQTVLLHTGSNIHTVEKLKIPYRGNLPDQDEDAPPLSDLRYIVLDKGPLIMKKNLLVRSPVNIQNNCTANLRVMFWRNEVPCYNMQIAPGFILPCPVDLLDAKITLDVANVPAKNDLKLWCAEAFELTTKPRHTLLNDLHCLHLHTVKDADDEDLRKLHVSPVLIIRNLFLADVSVRVFRNSLDREYFDRFVVTSESGMHEVFSPIEDEIIFAFKTGIYKSEKIHIKLDEVLKSEKTGSCWMHHLQKRKFTLNYAINFMNGSYVLAIYCEHLIYDELFKPVLLYQRGEKFEDNLIDVTKLGVQPPGEGTNEQSLFKLNTSITHKSDSNKSKVFMLPFPKDPLWVSDSTNPYEISNVLTAVMGSSTHSIYAKDTKNNSLQQFDIVATNSVKKICNDPMIVINLTHIRHKYLLDNQCGHAIQVRQLQFGTGLEQTIEHGVITPLGFSPNDANQLERLVNIGIPGFEWSDSVDIAKSNLAHLMIKNIGEGKALQKVHNFSVENYISMVLQMTMKNNSHLITLKRESKMGSFKICNNLPDMVIFVSQDPKKLSRNVAELALTPNTWAYYSWPKPFTKPKDMFIRAYMERTQQTSDMMQINYTEGHASHDFFNMRIYHDSEFAGVSQNLTFAYILDKKADQTLNSSMEVNVPFLGLSIVGGRKQNRRELMFLSLTGVEMKKKNYNRHSVTKFKLRYLNIDNNSEYLASYPILFGPRFTKDDMIRNDWHHVDLYMKQMNNLDKNTPEGLSVINKLDLKLTDAVLKIEESFIHTALVAYEDNQKQQSEMDTYMKQGILSRLKTNPEKTQDFRHELVEFTKDNYKHYNRKELTPATRFVNEAVISPHALWFSFKQEADDGKRALSKYSKYLKSVGFDYIFSLEDVGLEFESAQFQNDIYSVETMQKAVVQQYTNNGIQSAVASVLDLNILGNPRKFVREVKKGITDMANKPEERLQKNKPIGKGVASGAQSFAKHTTVGVLNSLSTMTGTLANITSKMTLDKEYLRQRKLIQTQNANRAMGEMNVGLQKVGHSFGDSVSGVFKRPVEMAEDQGVIGAIKGSFIGLGGLIIKPITGILDFASSGTKTLSNVVNPDALMEPTQRVRNPRAFYGESSFIKYDLFLLQDIQ